MATEEGYYFKDQAGKMQCLDWQSDRDWSREESYYSNSSRRKYNNSGYKYKSKNKYHGSKPWSKYDDNYHREDKSQSLGQGCKMQEIFLNHCRKNRVKVQISYAPEEALQGYIIGFDLEAVILEVDQWQHLIYKSAIQSVLPLEEEHAQILSDDPLVIAKSYGSFV